MDLDPEIAQKLLNNIADSIKSFDELGAVPMIICGSQVRWDLKKLVDHFIPGVSILAFDEIPVIFQLNLLQRLVYRRLGSHDC